MNNRHFSRDHWRSCKKIDKHLPERQGSDQGSNTMEVMTCHDSRGTYLEADNNVTHILNIN